MLSHVWGLIFGRSESSPLKFYAGYEDYEARYQILPLIFTTPLQIISPGKIVKILPKPEKN